MSNQTVQKAVVVTGSTGGNITPVKMVLVNEDGSPTNVNGASVGSTAGAAAAASGSSGSSNQAARADHVHPRQTGAQLTLTGYTTGTAAAVSATDTANAAIAKLEARIAALEAG